MYMNTVILNSLHRFHTINIIKTSVSRLVAILLSKYTHKLCHEDSDQELINTVEILEIFNMTLFHRY